MTETNKQEEKFEELLKTKLNEQYNKGLHVGILSISKIILDKLNDNSKPLMKRINDVKKFCEAPWNKQKKIEQALEDTSIKAEQTVKTTDTSLEGNDGENVTENVEN